ncbi:MAG: hypothetical protein HRT57_04655 [Crocinitomicaceae bacterium]|nr:hypothetical protein [Crocinitomicaceae bacterium]
MRNIIILSFLFSISGLCAQTVSVSGLAPAYIGKKIRVYKIEDYLSYKQTMIASTTVDVDSTFSMTFKCDEIQKVIVKSNNNRGFIYIQPKGDYSIFFPERNIYEPIKPSGNDVEVGFNRLDSTDINYKLLGYQRWVDYFLSGTFHLRNRKDTTGYVEAFDGFKTRVQKAYESDTSENSTYLKTYVKFNIAGLENVNNVAERNRYEKHDFFIKYHPVEYNNDMYMEYITNYYEKIVPQLSNKTNEAFYQGILNSSPSMVMNALGSEYTLINTRIREIVMIKSLSELFYSNDYPQTNVIEILDSIVEFTMYKENTVIASNIRHRLINLVPGVIAPDFVLSAEGLETKTLLGLKGKHLYVHFFDPNSSENMKEIELIRELNSKYSKYVKFISVYKLGDEISKELKTKLDDMEWEIYPTSPTNSIWDKYQVTTYPHYTFLDATGYVIASPALGPTPNGNYQTIDESFFQLRKAWEYENKDGGELYNRNH